MCVCDCKRKKRRGLFCPPALSFLGDLEFILYVLLPNMIYNFLSSLCCKKHLGEMRFGKGS